jgi:hypothetical protein
VAVKRRRVISAITEWVRHAIRREWVRRWLPAALLMCIVAVYNQFPLTYPDSGDYIGNARNLAAGRTPGFFYRPFTYGVFLVPFATRYTIWFVPLAQGVLVASVVDLALRSAGVFLSARTFVALFAALSAFSTLPWFSGQLMPDIFTSLIILLFFVVVYGDEARGRRELWTTGGILAFAIATHLSHVPLYAALLLGALVVRVAVGGETPSWRRLIHATVPLAVAVFVVITPNYLLYREPVLSRSAHLFYLAHLVNDGLAQRFLDRVCPTERYFLCADRVTLRADTDWFLWATDGPGQRYDSQWRRGDAAFRREVEAIIAGTVRQELPAVVGLSLRAAAIQLVTFGAHRGEHKFSRSVHAAMERIRLRPSYLGSRQVQGTLPLEVVTVVQYVGVGVGLLLLLGCLIRLRGPAERSLRLLIATACAGVALNALVVGSLALVANRYQRRVVWLIPLLGMVAAAQVFARRRASARPAERWKIPGAGGSPAEDRR